ncbi:MAG: sugar phosphate isomerase/epimerase family protein [Bryobacteraceae bacterium]
MNRRVFASTLGLAAGAAALSMEAASPKRRLKAGHTGITWDNNVPQALEDCGKLGFQGFETFGQVMEAWDANGGMERVLEPNHVPLVSAYCGFNMTDPTKRQDEMAKMVRWGQLLKKHNGKVVVMGPNGVPRGNYVFADHKADIVTSLNEVAKAITDLGLTAVLHQHTGTCVMTREETYGVMESVDTKYVKFGPDVGQLAKGGSDPVKAVSDFASIIRHVHLKDFDGGNAFIGYCPLGQGKVELSKVLDILEQSGNDLTIMAELDSGSYMPISATKAATINRDFFRTMGYSL